MDFRSVHMLIRYCQALDPRIGRKDDEEMALAVTAWHAELPIAMTPKEAQSIAHEIHRKGLALTPGAIGRRYDELHTPPHQQGVTRSPRPASAPQPEPVGQRHALQAIQGPPPDGATVSALMDRYGVRRRRQAPDVACPWCGAAPGVHCTRGDGEHPLRAYRSHPSRLDAAAGLDTSRVIRRAERAPVAQEETSK